ncbi:MAG TPA: DUF222 domain-containing protein [Acidimicrobiales bacterium]|nr:DUF222 domain-containing protein [Acidimicrobiales bacterium]
MDAELLGLLVEVVVKELHEVLDRAAEVDVAGLGDVELETALIELGSLEARVAALRVQVAGEWDARRLWATRGYRSAASALAHKHRVPQAACGRVPRWGRKLRDLPAVAVAWGAGSIGDAHVQRILGIDTPRIHEALVADQVEIVRWAMTLGWRPFLRRLQDWVDTHDPDGPEPDGAHRRFSCSRTIEDRWRLDGWLDPVPGTIFHTELSRLQRQLFLEDQREATDRLGHEPLPFQFRRSAEQRRADALVLMAERSATLPEDGRRGRPLFTVLTGADSLRRILELTNGIELRPAQLVDYVDPALFEKVLFETPVKVIGVSRQRTYRDLLRKAILVRDRGCQHPGCDAPIDDCEIDHKIPASQGGPTSDTNGRAWCGPHNRARNHPDYVEPDGGDEPPPGQA